MIGTFIDSVLSVVPTYGPTTAVTAVVVYGLTYYIQIRHQRAEISKLNQEIRNLQTDNILQVSTVIKDIEARENAFRDHIAKTSSELIELKSAFQRGDSRAIISLRDKCYGLLLTDYVHYYAQLIRVKRLECTLHDWSWDEYVLAMVHDEISSWKKRLKIVMCCSAEGDDEGPATIRIKASDVHNLKAQILDSCSATTRDKVSALFDDLAKVVVIKSVKPSMTGARPGVE